MRIKKRPMRRHEYITEELRFACVGDKLEAYDNHPNSFGMNSHEGGGREVREWKVCRQMIHPVQPLYSVCCKINGVPTTDNRLYASQDEAWKRLKKLRAMGEAERTEWRIGCRFVRLTISLYQVCAGENGVYLTAPDVYPTHEAAQRRANRLNKMEETS